MRFDGWVTRGHALAAEPQEGRAYDRCSSVKCLSENEQQILEDLTAVVIPSDAAGPGAREAGVVHEITRKVTADSILQQRYREGLRAFDDIARSRFGSGFHELNAENQVKMFSEVDQARQRIWVQAEPKSFSEKIRRKLEHWYYRKYVGVTDAALVLQEQMIRDVPEIFYATDIAWKSVGYSGPPFPFGYVGRQSSCAG
ncbi:gluconate 2-dehydrogenase subunit 3 family protein [Nitrospira sp. KM1]|uniref:gluconate 2-dehydrogenase subunit 3 family protein n=1 Tax=Nitrospira sp. KM1 TaxID=1936990 RepID=UPI001565EA91|nr:gluconate 2-dehydrogenase subunit 3 family protein [Nitrospira sp. KM1]